MSDKEMKETGERLKILIQNFKNIVDQGGYKNKISDEKILKLLDRITTIIEPKKDM